MFHHRRRGKKGMYHVYWREDNRQRTKAVSTDIQVVREFERRLASRLHRKQSGLIIKDVSFREFCDEYINIYSFANKRPSSVNRDLRTITLFKNRFPYIKKVEQYDINIVEQYKAHRLKEGVKESSINRELNTLTNMLKYAERKKYIEPSIEKVKRFQITQSARERVLTDEEIKKLIKETWDPFKTAVMLGLYAGLRSGEACNLEWTDIDAQNRIIRIRDKKEWKAKSRPSVRNIPLHPVLSRFLSKKSKKEGSPFVCAYADGSRLTEKVLCAMNRKFRLKLGIPGYCHHILRHTFVSRMAGAGADLYAISKIIGHSNTKITESTYTHLKDKYYHININRLKIPA